MEEEVTLDAEITRVIWRPFIIDRHLGCMINLTNRAFLVARSDLKGEERIVYLILYILRMDQSHVPYYYHMLAVALSDYNKSIIAEFLQ